MTPVQAAVAVPNVGLEGDIHALKYDTRQVLFMDKETLDSLHLAPGIIKENITVEGLDFSSIEDGEVFSIGPEVTMEVTGPCVPCYRMDEVRPGLQQILRGRRGILARVLGGGVIRVGDAVQVGMAPDVPA